MTVATAGHCVDPDWIDDGATLARSARVVFPAVAGFRTRSFTVARMVEVHAPPYRNFVYAADYAVLELAEPAGRPPIETAAGGAPDGLGSTVYYIADESQVGPIRGLIRRLDGEVVTGSLYLPFVDGPVAPTMLLGTMHVPPGSSGAPIVDPAGRLLGLVHGHQWSFETRELTRRNTPSELESAFEVRLAAGASFGTSIACIDFARAYQLRADGPCEPTTSQIANQYVSMRHQLARQAMEEREQMLAMTRAALLAEVSETFGGRWLIRTSERPRGTVRLVARPLCRPASLSTRRRIEIPRRTVRAFTDELWRPRVEVEVERPLRARFDPSLSVC